MPATYEPIATYTASGTPTSYTFSSVPQTYTDLILVCSFRNTTTSTSGDIRILMQFNGSGGTAYSNTQMYGDGSGRYSGYSANRSQIDNIFQSSSAATGEFGTAIYRIFDYANNNTNKVVLYRQNTINYQLNGYGVGQAAGVWRDTTPISSITLYNRVSNELWSNGSTFTLYGIKAA